MRVDGHKKEKQTQMNHKTTDREKERQNASGVKSIDSEKSGKVTDVQVEPHRRTDREKMDREN